MEPAAAGALYAVENLVEGAVAAAKGILHPTLPLKATFSHITSAPLPRASHTISIVKGRAYIFGGETRPNVLADNAMQVVILPSSGVLEADYKTILAKPNTPDGAVPAGRKGHSSVNVGDEVYVFGGELEAGIEEPAGRVWVFDTKSSMWSYFDPASGSPAPPLRTLHGATASEQPIHDRKRTDQGSLPQQPPDPSTVVPEPPSPTSFGTLFVSGGQEPASKEFLNDAWAFDIRTKTWTELPSPPAPARNGPSLACIANSLYRFGGYDSEVAEFMGGQIDVLDVSNVWKKDPVGGTTQSIKPLLAGWDWQEISHEVGKGPDGRSGARLIPVTTGQGRDYLLLIGGEGIKTHDKGKEVADSPVVDDVKYFNDVWAFQLSTSTKDSAANVKDVVREGMKLESKTAVWAEVQYQYVDLHGDVQKTNTEVIGTKGIDHRGNFAAARGTEVDGASVVVWGGVDGEGKVLGDGWMITVDR